MYFLLKVTRNVFCPETLDYCGVFDKSYGKTVIHFFLMIFKFLDCEYMLLDLNFNLILILIV